MRPARASASFSVTSTPTGSRSHCWVEMPASPSWSQPAASNTETKSCASTWPSSSPRIEAIVIFWPANGFSVSISRRFWSCDRRFCDCVRSSSATRFSAAISLCRSSEFSFSVAVEADVGAARCLQFGGQLAHAIRRSPARPRPAKSAGAGRSRRPRSRSAQAARARRRSRSRRSGCATDRRRGRAIPARRPCEAARPRTPSGAAISATSIRPASCAPSCSRVTLSSESHPGMSRFTCEFAALTNRGRC